MHGLRARPGARRPADARRSTCGSTRRRRPRSPTRRSGRSSPPPGGTPVAIDRCRDRSRIRRRTSSSTLAGLPDPARYRLLRRAARRRRRSTRCARGCPSACGPSATTSAAASVSRSRRALPAPSPVRDYLARDWRALRQALVEYLLRGDPDADVSIADPTITLIELFAHVGDLLNYRLDRVATEAYLETARAAHVGAPARAARRLRGRATASAAETFVHVVGRAPRRRPSPSRPASVAVDAPGSDLAFTLEAGAHGRRAARGDPDLRLGRGGVLPAGRRDRVRARAPAGRRPARRRVARARRPARRSRSSIPTTRRATPAGRTACSRWPHRRRRRSRASATRCRAGPRRSCELTAVEHVRRSAARRRRSRCSACLARRRTRSLRAYPVGVDTSAGARRGDRRPREPRARAPRPARRRPAGSDARAARSRTGRIGATTPPVELSLIAAGSPARGRRAGGPGLSIAPARLPDRPEPRPHRLDVSVLLPSGLTVPATRAAQPARRGRRRATRASSTSRSTSRRSCASRRARSAWRRRSGSQVSAAYEVGGGTRGNVPANALRVLEENASAAGETPSWQVVAGVAVRNPVPAAGGADPTPLDVVRRDAPGGLRRRAAARRAPGRPRRGGRTQSRSCERAMAQRAWSGSWPLIATVVDLDGRRRRRRDEAPRRAPGAARRPAHARHRGRRSSRGRRSGCCIALEVCARPGVDPERAARRDPARCSGPGTDDRPGLFHPSRLELGVGRLPVRRGRRRRRAAERRRRRAVQRGAAAQRARRGPCTR